MWKIASKRVARFFTAGLLLGLGASPGLCENDAGHLQTEKFTLHKQAADRCLRRGRVTEAIDKYEKSLAIDPSSTAVYFNLAIAHYANRNVKGAARALEKLTERDPRDVEALYNLACLYLYEGNIEKAGSYIEKAGLCYDPQETLFAPMVEQSLSFLNELERMDPRAQAFILRLLQKNPPPPSLI